MGNCGGKEQIHQTNDQSIKQKNVDINSLVVEVLKEHVVGKNLDTEDLIKFVMEISQIKSYKKDDIILAFDDTTPQAHIVITGQVTLMMNLYNYRDINPETNEPRKSNHEVDTVLRGDAFGFSHINPMMGAIATTHVTLITFSENRFKDLLSSCPQYHKYIFKDRIPIRLMMAFSKLPMFSFLRENKAWAKRDMAAVLWKHVALPADRVLIGKPGTPGLWDEQKYRGVWLLLSGKVRVTRMNKNNVVIFDREVQDSLLFGEEIMLHKYSAFCRLPKAPVKIVESLDNRLFRSANSVLNGSDVTLFHDSSLLVSNKPLTVEEIADVYVPSERKSFIRIASPLVSLNSPSAPPTPSTGNVSRGSHVFRNSLAPVPESSAATLDVADRFEAASFRRSFRTSVSLNTKVRSTSLSPTRRPSRMLTIHETESKIDQYHKVSLAGRPSRIVNHSAHKDNSTPPYTVTAVTDCQFLFLPNVAALASLLKIAPEMLDAFSNSITMKMAPPFLQEDNKANNVYDFGAVMAGMLNADYCDIKATRENILEYS